MTDILISPLGRSPGSVSGVYFALKKRGFDVSKVVTVGTSHKDVIFASDGFLRPIFDFMNVIYDPIHLPEKELRDERRSVMPYAGMIGWAIENGAAEYGKDHVHVAVTGGRSGMGALAALAAQLYGAHKMWHIWVPAEIEEGGTVDFLRGLTSPEKMCQSPFLNPTMWGKHAFDLVDLPFMNLSPFQDEIRQYWRTGQFSDGREQLSEFISKAGVQNIFRVFPAGMTFEQAERVIRLVNRYEGAGSAPGKEKIQFELIRILQSAGVIEAGEATRLLNILKADAPREELFNFRSKDRMGLWHWLKKNKDEIGVTIDAMTFFLAALTLWLQVAGLIK